MKGQRSGFLLGRRQPFKIRDLRLLRYLVLATGLTAMMAMTVPRLRAETSPWLDTILWGCLAFYSAELAVRTWENAKAGNARLLSGTLVIDVLSVLPIPAALLAGVPTETAWLLASLWLLKIAEVVPGLSLLGRIIQHEARALGERIRYILDRPAACQRCAVFAGARGSARAIRQFADVAMVGSDDPDHHRLWRRGAGNLLGPCRSPAS